MGTASATVFTNSAAVTITTAWTKIALAEYVDNGSRGAPTYGDHFALVGTQTNNPTSLTYQFTYDTAGNDPASNPVAVSLTAPPGGGTNLLGCAQGVDVHFAWERTGRTPGTIYLWAKTDVATSTLALAIHTGVSHKLLDARSGGS